MKKTLKILGATALSALLCTTGLLYGCAGKNSPSGGSDGDDLPPPYTPQYTVDESAVDAREANDDMYLAANVEKAESPLAGKVIYWLGSSVTYGASSNGESMADFLAAKTGCISKKEAVSGTTIFDNGGSDYNTGAGSYTRRLTTTKNFDRNEHVDAFVCQISTNDAWGDRKKNWGEISAYDKLYTEDFDISTTLGGIEYIIAYVTDTWGCPIYFYSSSYFGDTGRDAAPRANGNPKGSDYGELVDKVLEIAEKWQYWDVDVKVIDLFHDEAFNAQVSDAYYSWATSDPIHPKKAGYLQWWMPYFECRFLNDGI